MYKYIFGIFYSNKELNKSREISKNNLLALQKKNKKTQHRKDERKNIEALKEINKDFNIKKKK